MEVMDDGKHFGLISVLTASATMLIYQLPSPSVYGSTIMLLFTLVSDHEVSSTLMRSTANIFVLLYLALVL
jgi:hypothetical protein